MDQRSAAAPYQACFQAMGTRMQLLLPDVDRQRGDFLRSEIAQAVEALEQSLSIFRPDSAVSLLNEALSTSCTAQTHDSHLLQALRMAEAGHAYTGGYYNAACGALIESAKRGEVTGHHECSFTLGDSDQLTANRPGIRFDFGGLGKGMALDEVQAILVREGIGNALVSFGESSILCLGQHPHGDCWPISVPDPVNGQRTLAEIPLRDCGLTLSSTVANGANRGTIQHHIYNPLSGELVSAPLTTTVESESLGWGEILSTASLVSGLEFSSAQLTELAGLKSIKNYRH